MFCWQCEQTSGGKGCTQGGVCGKDKDVAVLQDLLIFKLKNMAKAVRSNSPDNADIQKCGRLAASALFSTLTNVNFNPARIEELINRVDRQTGLILKTGGQSKASHDDLLAQGQAAGLQDLGDPVILSLRETAIYGLKGLAAYADHAALLGQEDNEVYAFMLELLAACLDRALPMDKWLNYAMEVGKYNLKAMELLDKGNTTTFGHPLPVSVPLGHRAGKAILVSGHDLLDLRMLLEQTSNLGITVYTHGEMLPAHGYPELKKHPHFFGHFGTAWQNQAKEFPKFPGAVIFTTNCIQKPVAEIKDHIFTTGLVGWPGLTHIEADDTGHKDFLPVIEKSLSLPGFESDQDAGSVLTGFGHQAVLGVADKIIAAVKAKKIRHFFLVGGCDGAKPGRNYYSEFVAMTPPDTVVLTLACGKFRFFDQQLGTVEGLPRLLDIGQCNDAFSAVQIALALAKAFDCGVNDLPLSLILSWYEQKACAILLTLLYLGIKNIRLGPTLPAFIHPDVLKVLVDNFNIAPISTPEADLKAILG